MNEERIVRKSLLIRCVEEQLLKSFQKGELSGTIHTCVGQEFSGAIVSEFLEIGDSIFSNHRCHGHFLAFTNDVIGLIAEVYGKKSGVCGGRGGSQHLCKDGFYSNGVQGGILPIAAGLAYAKKLKKENKISVVYIGDGTLGEGVVYETLNIVSQWQLPLLIVLENNLYAQSTHQSENLAGDIGKRASAFDIFTLEADIWDLYKLYRSTSQVVQYVRDNKKPAFFTINCYRLNAHSKSDDNRNLEEVEKYKQADPLSRIIAKSSMYAHLKEEVEKQVEEYIEKARQDSVDTYADMGTLKQYLFNNLSQPNDLQETRIVKELNNTFKEIMAEDERIIFLGEDVRSPYGGAFKVSQELSYLFPDRVINTPISEAAIVGIGCGLALEGYKPVVEIMFGDFITLAFDQIINHLSKFRYMYNDQVQVPLIIRTPMGGGRGYGPTHSQTLDQHLLGIPGLKVFAINSLITPKILYKSLLNNSIDPSIVIENKVLYTQMLRKNPPQGFSYIFTDEKYPTVLVLPQAEEIDFTIITYGGLSNLALDLLEKLFYEHDLIGQLICPIQIYPYDIIPYEQIIKKSRYLFTIEEGQGFSGFNSEIISQLAEKNLTTDLIIKRISALPSSIPASRPLESKAIPDFQQILNIIVETYYE